MPRLNCLLSHVNEHNCLQDTCVTCFNMCRELAKRLDILFFLLFRFSLTFCFYSQLVSLLSCDAGIELFFIDTQWCWGFYELEKNHNTFWQHKQDTRMTQTIIGTNRWWMVWTHHPQIHSTDDYLRWHSNCEDGVNSGSDIAEFELTFVTCWFQREWWRRWTARKKKIETDRQTIEPILFVASVIVGKKKLRLSVYFWHLWVDVTTTTITTTNCSRLLFNNKLQ